MPKVSVVIPTYNRAHIIPRTIQSVRNQTFKDFEIILVDDGSSDNTREVIEALQKTDRRIRYIYQENSGAPARPKNFGIKQSKGEYVAFLDDDDEWLPGKLEKQVQVFENSKVYNLGLVGCDAFVVNTLGGVLYRRKMRKSSDYVRELLLGNFIFTSSSVLLKNAVFSEVGLHDENFRIGDDWDMWIRVSKKYGLDFVHEPLIKHYMHGNNVSSLFSDESRIKEYEYGLKKYIHLYQKYPRVFSHRLGSIGRMHFLASRKREARRYFKDSIKVNPFNLRGYMNFFLLFGNTRSYLFCMRIKEKYLKKLYR